MFGSTFLTSSGFEHPRGRASPLAGATGSRRIALLRSGRRHGPITRLITPWDIGELTQPFVFLGYTEHEAGARIVAGAAPGIATLTLVVSGALAFEDVRGKTGTVSAGGFKWATPGEVVWYAADRVTGEPARDLQLWVELPAMAAGAAGDSLCVAPHEVEEEGPVRVLLGQLGRARSPLAHAALDINYFHVRLKDGQRWRYAAPAAHNITWIAVNRGAVSVPADGHVLRKQIALFGDSGGVIELQADGESSFVLGSTRRVSNASSQGVHYSIDTTYAACAPRGNEASALDRRLAPGKRQ